MKILSRALFASACSVPLLSLAQLPKRALQGYVTRAGTAQDFDVKEQRVLCTPKTFNSVRNGALAIAKNTCDPAVVT